jgi:hypothetical protein
MLSEVVMNSSHDDTAGRRFTWREMRVTESKHTYVRHPVYARPKYWLPSNN